MRRALVLLAALWLAHCDREDVIVGEVPWPGGAGGEAGQGGAGAGGDAGAAGDGGAAGDSGASGQAGKGEPCRGNDDCAPLDFCQKTACDPAALGECQPRPVQCPRGFDERCGCDGVTYWNDCLRRLLGVASSRDGRCKSDAVVCTGEAGQCPFEGASCALLGPHDEACDDAHPGTCWLLPPVCPAEDDGPAWGRCDGSGACDRLCEAIRSERPHRVRLGPACEQAP